MSGVIHWIFYQVRITTIYCVVESESIIKCTKYNIRVIVLLPHTHRTLPLKSSWTMNLTGQLLKSSVSSSCDDDVNQNPAKSTQQQQRRPITKSKVRFKSRSACHHQRCSLSHDDDDNNDNNDNFDTEKSCDKIIILSRRRKTSSTMTSNMCWKNILVFSVIVLIYLATKDCIAAARQLEGMLSTHSRSILYSMNTIVFVIKLLLPQGVSFWFDFLASTVELISPTESDFYLH